MSFEIAALSTHATDNQLAKVQQHINVLRRKIDTWRDIQLLYMPFVSRLLASEDSLHSPAEPTPVEAIRLWLPSTVGPITQCSTQLCRFEWMLRYAQANDALKDIRNLLRLRSHLYKFKDTNIVGQAANTRTRSTINKADNKVSMAAGRYKAARAALTSLAPLLNEDEAWKDVLKPLNRHRDLKSFKDMWEKETEGTRHLSWIWKTPGVSENTSVGLHDGKPRAIFDVLVIDSLLLALCIEWCKARARAMRWEEEVELLKEEQRRIVTFFEWQAHWWSSQRQRRDSESLDDPGLREGLAAYAERQSSLRRALSAHFQNLWTLPILSSTTTATGSTLTV